MSFDLREWDYRRCKGTITSYVARGRGMPERIAKSIRTTMTSGHFGRAEVAQMLAETERDAVQPFLDARWNQLERLDRFRDIKIALDQALA